MDDHNMSSFRQVVNERYKFGYGEFFWLFFAGFLGATLNRIIFLQGMIVTMNRYSTPLGHWCDGSTVEFWFTFPIYSVGSIVLALKDGWGFALLFVILWCVYLCM